MSRPLLSFFKAIFSIKDTRAAGKRITAVRKNKQQSAERQIVVYFISVRPNRYSHETLKYSAIATTS